MTYAQNVINQEEQQTVICSNDATDKGTKECHGYD